MFELTIGIVGATGVVGQTAIDILADNFSGFTVKKLKLYASKASAGKSIQFRSSRVTIEEPLLSSMLECNVILFASDSNISQEFIPKLVEHKILCIDKSSAFRTHPLVPLVVPEINGDLLLSENLINFPVVASPNCCTIPLVSVLKPLYENFGIIRTIVSTYQSVSGAGKLGIETLTEETKKFFNDHDLTCEKSEIFPKSIAFNVMPFVSDIQENGNTDEETKIIFETRKILEIPNFPIGVTSVRVPTFVGHAESVTLEFPSQVTVENIIALLSQYLGICLIDEKSSKNEELSQYGTFVTPREVHGKNEVFVCRIRKSEAFQNGISMWIACDNLRKGAALNAIQIINKCALNGIIKLKSS